MRTLLRLAAALAAAASTALAAPALAADPADWAACQGPRAPTGLDDLIDQCAGAATCEAERPEGLSRLMAGCTAVIQSPAEPVLRRALAAYQRGAAHALQNEPAAAVADFSFALTLRPDFTQAAERLGEAYAARGDEPRAIAEETLALRMQPGMARAYSARAQAEYRGGEIGLAIADLSEALAVRPDNAADLNNRCVMRATLRRELNAALEDCTRAAALAPRAAAVHDSLGFVLLVRQEYAAALAEYRTALAANDASIKASSLYGGGLARIGLGDQAQGRADVASALALSPTVAAAFAAAGLHP